MEVRWNNDAIGQLGPWKEQNITADKAWAVNQLEKTITSLDWRRVAEDVRRFIRTDEQPSLDLWSEELFLRQLDKLKRSHGESA